MSDADELSQVESAVTSDDVNLSKVITAGSEAAGVAFSVASVAKFKHAKDGPEHSHAGTPIAEDVAAAELLALPSLEGSDLTASDVKDAASKVSAADVTAAKTEAEKLAG